jgi:hypothetical protein
MAVVGVQQHMPAFRAAFTSGDYAKARSLLTELKVRPHAQAGGHAIAPCARSAPMRANARPPTPSQRTHSPLRPLGRPARPPPLQILMTEFPYQKQSNGLAQPSAEEAGLARESLRCVALWSGAAACGAGHPQRCNPDAPLIVPATTTPSPRPLPQWRAAGQVLEVAVLLSVKSGDIKAFERNVAQIKPFLASVGCVHAFEGQRRARARVRLRARSPAQQRRRACCRLHAVSIHPLTSPTLPPPPSPRARVSAATAAPRRTRAGTCWGWR